MGFQFPPPALSSPLTPKPHPTTLSSYLKRQRLLPITPPHTKPEAQAMQTEVFPLGLLVFIFPLPRSALLPCALTVFAFAKDNHVFPSADLGYIN